MNTGWDAIFTIILFGGLIVFVTGLRGFLAHRLPNGHWVNRALHSRQRDRNGNILE